MKKCSTSLIFKKIKIIMSSSFLLITFKILCLIIWCLELCGEVVLLYCTDESDHWYMHSEKTIWYDLLYLWVNIHYKPEVPFMDICSRGQNHLRCCCLAVVMSNALATPWITAHQATLSMEFSRQEYWSGVLFPSPGDPPNTGIEP